MTRVVRPRIPAPEATPTVGTGKDVKTYMGEQAVNPLMPAQGVYTPMAQQVMEGYETIDPAMGSVRGTPSVTQTQAGQERAVAAPAQGAAKAGVSTVTGKTPTVDVQTGKVLEFQDSELIDRLNLIANNAGYQLVDHNLVLHVKKKDS